MICVNCGTEFVTEHCPKCRPDRQRAGPRPRRRLPHDYDGLRDALEQRPEGRPKSARRAEARLARLPSDRVCAGCGDIVLKSRSWVIEGHDHAVCRSCHWRGVRSQVCRECGEEYEALPGTPCPRRSSHGGT